METNAPRSVTGLIQQSVTAPTRTESLAPVGYRLGKKPDGTLVLQGAFHWQEGWSNHGHEWRDLPTVDLE